MPLYLPAYPVNPVFFSDSHFAREVRHFFKLNSRGNEFGNIRQQGPQGMKGMVYDEAELVKRYDPAADDLMIWRELVGGEVDGKGEGKAEGSEEWIGGKSRAGDDDGVDEF